MRRTLEILLLISTTVILIATSRAPEPCASETVVLHARTTCGEETNLNFTSTPSCTVTVNGGGFPSSGPLANLVVDAGVMGGFELFGPRVDGGVPYSCSAIPEDGGLFMTCSPNVTCVPDAGADAGPCAHECSGMLTLP